jgi:PhzF family phenazine biosynthesis protein
MGLVLLPFFQVDAFASKAFTGNPAGVVVTDEPLDPELMAQIANENQLSETAFVIARGAHFFVRWFSPSQEVPFCGHATLAAAHVLMSEYGAEPPVLFETTVGVLSVDVVDGALSLEIPSLAPLPADEWSEVCQLLCPAGYVRAFQNFENLFVELKDEGAIRAYEPNLSLISSLHPRALCITAVGDDADFVSRYFAPSYGIPEDPVTGSTHATLVPYWANRLGRDELLARQLSRRGGDLRARAVGARVELTGNARTYLKGTIYLPLAGARPGVHP